MIRTVVAGLACALPTLVLVLFGVTIGVAVLVRQHHLTDGALASAFFNWDGSHYLTIGKIGYTYDPGVRSNVAFFPVFPLAGAILSWFTGWSEATSLIIVSNVCLTATFAGLWHYMQRTRPDSNSCELGWTVVVFSVWPLTFFMRMAYSESVFLCLLVFMFIAMSYGCRPVVVACIAGLATGTRPTGVAVLPVVALYFWDQIVRVNDADASLNSATTVLPSAGNFAESSINPLGLPQAKYHGTEKVKRQRLLGIRDLWRLSWLILLSAWGLIAYMAYLQFTLGDGLAFMRTQQHWARRPVGSWSEYVISLLTLEPIWSNYLSSSSGFWKARDFRHNPIFSLEFANPIYFAGTVALVVLGVRRRWLTTHEWLLSAGLLTIPYVTHSYRTYMLGHGRYAAAAFPVYIVMGRLLSRAPQPLAAICCAASSFLMTAYSALFAAFYNII